MNERRQFLKRASQLLMLSGLVGGSAYLVARNGISASCDNSEMCGNCSKLKGCEVDKAKKYRVERNK
ncbi:MAG: hypothetical protein A2W90_04165 [Bacteroidetes bacterium GWF2_42_66]|nr:MAG: hypothetical protein A2W92_06980 [Bacteroidetes bacterium GWA2_42_15]OFY02485.1 MAG: hypothetical protein A2W89_21690 [Bacteroidetes bacterium GWE2_42_39]OFY41417.1 MAG: hypothetical protein A2W90_04165 [Bacteroidetes bacterium GWF2_42_66]HBL75378.1 hypothetical protein [Prolixibacteraceae bacterium]HCU60713.1 hypothetical protein [Prolixibacteraceae bacterium]